MGSLTPQDPFGSHSCSLLWAAQWRGGTQYGGEDMACLQPAVPFHRQAAVPEKVLKGEAGDEEGWARASI